MPLLTPTPSFPAAAESTRPVTARPFLALGLLLCLLGPRLSTSAADASPKASVLTTFLPVHSIASSIAGPDARVENWLPAGIDPHDFQFSARDLRRLGDAGLLITGGLGLEGWDQARLRKITGNSALRILEASAGFPKEALITGEPGHHDHDHDHSHDHGHDHGAGPNPHFWLDPLLMKHAVSNVWQQLRELAPAHRDAFDQRARQFLARLDALHQDFETGLAPCRNTPFITYHDAFPYLARRYGLKLAGVVEVSAAEEPSARELAALYQRVRADKIQVLFTDGTPSRMARRMATDLGIKLASLETLETGELGPEAYERGMRRNLKALKDALAPAKP